MNYSSRLVSNLRVIFAIGRTLAVCMLVAYPGVVLFLGDKVPMPVGEIYFKAPSVSVRGEPDVVKNPAGKLTELRGQLSLRTPSAEQRAFHRAIGLMPTVIALVFGFFVCQWMWQLCRNVENGEIFSVKNVKLIRWLGILLIADAVAVGALNIWNGYMLADYARENVFVGGLQSVTPTVKLFFGSAAIGIDGGAIIMGLLVLSLAEVFRQGLALKQEADLTV